MKSLLLYLLLCTSLSSFAQYGDKGNGGGAHYCPAGSLKVEMYDLFEGQMRYDYVIADLEHLTRDEAIDWALTRIQNKSPKTESLVRKQIHYLREQKNLIPKKNISLMKVPDANFLFTEKGCSYEQLANWDNVTGKVFVDKELYDQMSPFNQGVLYIHEAVYKVARDTLKSDNSDHVRQIVAEIFSENETLAELSKWNVFNDVEVSSADQPVSLKAEFDRSRRAINISAHLGEFAAYSNDVKVKFMAKMIHFDEWFKRYSTAMRELDELVQKMDKEFENRLRGKTRKYEKLYQQYYTLLNKNRATSVVHLFGRSGSFEVSSSVPDQKNVSIPSLDPVDSKFMKFNGIFQLEVDGQILAEVPIEDSFYNLLPGHHDKINMFVNFKISQNKR